MRPTKRIPAWILLIVGGALAAADMAQAETTNSALSTRFEVASGAGSYALEVLRGPTHTTQVGAHSINIAPYNLKIACVNKCACQNVYAEVLGSGNPRAGGSGLLGVMLVRDDSDQIVTTWNMGREYAVKVFGCRSGMIAKLLDIPSISMPSIKADGEGTPVISTGVGEGRSRKTVTWIWRDGRYLKS
jgi:hypothetical protein